MERSHRGCLHDLQTVDELPDFNKISFPSLPPLPLQSVLPGASPGAIALLSKFLRYDPANRIPADEVRTVRARECCMAGLGRYL